MRTPSNERLTSDIADTPKARKDSGPERRCILSGETAPREVLVRLVASPEGLVLPDAQEKAPGRGAWIGVSRTDLAELPHLTEAMLVTLGKAGIKTLDDLADLATDELIQKKREAPRRRNNADGPPMRRPSVREQDKGGVLGGIMIQSFVSEIARLRVVNRVHEHLDRI